MPSWARAVRASTMGWAVLKSMSAIHRGITWSVPNFFIRSSYLAERLPPRSTTVSKSYFIGDHPSFSPGLGFPALYSVRP